MKIEEKIVTMLEFRTKVDSVYIDDAMRAVFPLAEWNETRNCSTFKSNSLCPPCSLCSTTLSKIF